MATYSEVKAAKEEYDLSQKETNTALENYNDLIATLDKDTCGWVTQFKKGTNILNVNTESGDSLGIPKAHYLVEDSIQDLQSKFTLTIPEETNIKASYYELWVEGLRIGERLPVTTPMIVLPVEIKGLKTVTVKLYDDDGLFIDEAEFDGLETSGDLNFKIQVAKNDIKAKEQNEELKASLMDESDEKSSQKQEVGNYFIEEFLADGGIELSKFKVSELPDNIAYFSVYVENDGVTKLADNNLIPISREIVKLKIFFAKESEVRVVLYDSNRNKLFLTKLDPVNGKLVEV